MKTAPILFLMVFFLSTSQVVCQNYFSDNTVEGDRPIKIGLDEINKCYVPPQNIPHLKSGLVKKSNFKITCINVPDEATKAIEYAISIWEQNISSPVAINVTIKWEEECGNLLAYAGATNFIKNFPAAPFDDVYYPIALAEKLMGEDINQDKEADIVCFVNSQVNWYFGTDGNTPVTKYDLVSAILHEIAHGLGFSGFFDTDGSQGKINNPTQTPSIYDIYLFNKSNQQLVDSNVFEIPSCELHNQFTSNSLKFKYSSEDHSDVFSPTSWSPGISLYHLKKFNDSGERELMSPYAYKGEAIHNLGENTLNVISEIGWETAYFKMEELYDIEETADSIPIICEVFTPLNIDNNAVKFHFSFDNFKTRDSLQLTLNNYTKKFEGWLPVNKHIGRVQYFYSAKAADNSNCFFPKDAPSSMLSFKIGTDYYLPELKFNPIRLISAFNPTLNFSVKAKDNLGINTVKVEYTINGIEQEPFSLESERGDIYTGDLKFPIKLNVNDIVEYRVVAEDVSARKNKRYMPSNGFYDVEIVAFYNPVRGYSSDFEDNAQDFVFDGFQISTPYDFSNNTLHTFSPYNESGVEGLKKNTIAALKYPVIVEENGRLSFEEIVLVEPGELGSNYTEDNFYDFVIVEASKDFGVHWTPLSDGYDAGKNVTWKNEFITSIKNNCSYASGQANMFSPHSFSITENGAFSAGDTIIIRFRLAADNSLNGWGWAIDNLKIQNETTTPAKEILAGTQINIYPNPFVDKLVFDINNVANTQSSVQITISDLAGETIYAKTVNDIRYNHKIQVDMSTLSSGIYLASISGEKLSRITRKIIKN
ncbi:MAG: hypothetical protein CSA36_06695 [Draconibacterium sp.]|nr:MAG: hypothetical protein CSA36_06695 [Draconibacterium sp.]